MPDNEYVQQDNKDGVSDNQFLEDLGGSRGHAMAGPGKIQPTSQI